MSEGAWVCWKRFISSFIFSEQKAPESVQYGEFCYFQNLVHKNVVILRRAMHEVLCITGKDADDRKTNNLPPFTDFQNIFVPHYIYLIFQLSKTCANPFANKMEINRNSC